MNKLIFKLFIYLFLASLTLHANVYYSKVEPFEVRNISANVTGLVSFIDESMLGKKLTSKGYIKIDSELDEDELKYTKEKLLYSQKNLESNEKIVLNLEESLKKKRDNYEKIKLLKIKSKLEKDREFYELINSENIYLNTKKEINIIQTQISDLKLRKSQLKRSIKDKNLQGKGLTLYSLDVKVGQVVTRSLKLATLVDTSKAILTIYLDKENVEFAKNSVIFIDDVETTYKVSRISYLADSINISKYKAQIIIKAPKIFSQLVKIEFR